tara:strand:- start:56 stop:259 length:204 start_codon:yes stop_codon:yes gene_type:complete
MTQEQDQPIVFANKEEFKKAVFEVLRENLIVEGTLREDSLDLSFIEKDCSAGFPPCFCDADIDFSYD